jgi:hypothetical protein
MAVEAMSVFSTFPPPYALGNEMDSKHKTTRRLHYALVFVLYREKKNGFTFILGIAFIN